MNTHVRHYYSSLFQLAMNLLIILSLYLLSILPSMDSIVNKASLTSDAFIIQQIHFMMEAMHTFLAQNKAYNKIIENTIQEVLNTYFPIRYINNIIIIV